MATVFGKPKFANLIYRSSGINLSLRLFISAYERLNLLVSEARTLRNGHVLVMVFAQILT